MLELEIWVTQRDRDTRIHVFEVYTSGYEPSESGQVNVNSNSWENLYAEDLCTYKHMCWIFLIKK